MVFLGRSKFEIVVKIFRKCWLVKDNFFSNHYLYGELFVVILNADDFLIFRIKPVINSPFHRMGRFIAAWDKYGVQSSRLCFKPDGAGT